MRISDWSSDVCSSDLESLMLPLMQPVPLADVPQGTILRIVGAAGAGFPSPAQDWQDDAISLIELLRLDRAASLVFRISGSSMIDAGIHDNDVVGFDRDTRPAQIGRAHVATPVTP